MIRKVCTVVGIRRWTYLQNDVKWKQISSYENHLSSSTNYTSFSDAIGFTTQFNSPIVGDNFQSVSVRATDSVFSHVPDGGTCLFSASEQHYHFCPKSRNCPLFTQDIIES